MDAVELPYIMVTAQTRRGNCTECFKSSFISLCSSVALGSQLCLFVGKSIGIILKSVYSNVFSSCYFLVTAPTHLVIAQI